MMGPSLTPTKVSSLFQKEATSAPLILRWGVVVYLEDLRGTCGILGDLGVHR